MFLSVQLANGICVMAVLFICLFILPKHCVCETALEGCAGLGLHERKLWLVLQQGEKTFFFIVKIIIYLLPDGLCCMSVA